MLILFVRVALAATLLSVPTLGFQSGAIAQFGDRATWQRVSSNTTNVSFAGLGGLGSSLDTYYPDGIEVNGTLFQPYRSNYLYIRSSPNFMFGPQDSDLGCPPPQAGCGSPGAGIKVTLPAGVNSLGLDVGGFWPPGPAVIRFSNGQTFAIPLNQNSSSTDVFSGFASSTPLGSFILEAAGNPIIWTLSFGSYTPPSTPFISPSGIVPIYSSSGSVQPGEWIAIYGLNLATNSQVWSGDFPTSLAGTTVKIDGKSAYLWYAGPNQINAQVPDDAARATVSVTVTNSLGSASANVKLSDISPSFCLLDATHVSGIILRADGSGAYGGGTYDILGPTGNALGFAAVAAAAGDHVAIFGVGFGPTFPAVPAGEAFNGALATTNSVRMEIGNSPVMVLMPSFAGLVSAGLYQINFTVPPGLGTGDLPINAIVGNTQTQSGVVISLR